MWVWFPWICQVYERWQKEWERGKEGSKEGNWNGQRFLSSDSTGWILNTSIVQAHVCGPKLTCLALWGIAGIKADSHGFISALHICQKWLRRWDVVSALLLFCLWVSSSCRLLRGQLPHVAPGAKVKETCQDTNNLEGKVLRTSCSRAVISLGVPPDYLPLFDGIRQRSEEKLWLVLVLV